MLRSLVGSEMCIRDRYDYGYGEYIGNDNAGAECMNNAAAIGIPAAGSSSKVSFMLNVDPAVMNSAANNLPENWSFSTVVYDAEGNQVGTPGLANDVGVGVDDFNFENSFKIYPNPAKDVLFIESTLQDNFTIEMFDLIGNLMTVDKLSNNRLDISGVPSGMYLVKLNFENKSVAKKIIVH